MVIAWLTPGVGVSHAAIVTIEQAGLVAAVDGQQLTLQTPANGSARFAFPRIIESVSAEPVQDPVWGEGKGLRLTHADGWITRVRLFKQPFVHISFEAASPADQTLNLKRTSLLKVALDLGVPAEQLRVLGTAGLSALPAEGSYTFTAIADPETRAGVVSAWLTHERGVGVFLPGLAEGRAEVETLLEFGQFQVQPGKSRPLDTLVLGFFDDVRLGLEAYADAVARQYAISLKPQPGVYCTWYHGGASNQEKLAANTAFAAEHLKPFGLNVMQIDDKWQSLVPKGFAYEGSIKKTGPIKVFVDTEPNYPLGMAHTAKHITAQGMIPGIWYMPFAGNFRNPYFDHEMFAKNPDGTPFHDERWSGTCLDLSHPKARAYVAETARRIHGWGYRYFKLDGMHTGAPSKNIYVHTAYREDTFPDSLLSDPGMTHVEAYRQGLEIVRENAPDTFILGCNVSQNMVSMGPAFGLIDGMRIGPDNGGAGNGKWGSVKKGAWHGSTLYFLNGRVWHNDPDPVYVRPSNPLESARLMCSWVAITGSMLTTSYQFADLPAERLDLLKRTLSGVGLPGRPVDLMETDQARIWLLTDTRTGTRRDVVGLFNWDEKAPAEVNYDLGKLGLDARARYTAFDFWENRFLGAFQGALQQTLPGGTCRILAVRPVADHPQLLSTSRHITQGMVDVLEETWNGRSKILQGRSKVVAGDSYELRIALPEEGAWKVEHASVGGKAVDIQAEPGNVRVAFLPTKTGTVDWQVVFQP